MISNSLVPQEEFLFTNPDWLEQLKQELLNLVHQDQTANQSLHADLEALSASSYSPNWQVLRQAEGQLRERSGYLITVSQLALKMAECIRDQQQQLLGMSQRYERQIQILKEQNDCLLSRNSHIETDVEYFKEHLRAAEDRLEDITTLREESGREEEEDVQREKDRLIQQLEAEIERIRAELHFYRISSNSRKSLTSHSLLPNRSEQYIKPSIQTVKHLGQTDEEREIIVLKQVVQQLMTEIDSLKRQLNASHLSSTRSLLLPNNIRQQLNQIEQTHLCPIQPQSEPHIYSRKLPQDCENFTKQSTKPLIPSQEETPLCQTPSVADNLHTHALSSEWSTKSFELEHRHYRLIDLQEDEEDRHKHSSKRIQETKETEESVKEANCIKEMAHVGINTDPCPAYSNAVNNTVSALSSQKPVSFLDRLLQLESPLLKRVSVALVRGRIRRNTVKANRSLLLLP